MMFKLLLALSLFAGDGITAALRDFMAPPDNARTKVWWFHGETPTTKEGITADLEAFKEAGVGGIVYYDQVHGDGAGALEAFSPEWWEMLKFSAKEAGRIGLSFEINLSNGYVAGGPWITKDMSMQRICSSDTLIQGGRHISIQLAEPSSDEWFRDVAVLAFPVKASDWQKIVLSAGREAHSQFTAKSISYTAPKARKSRNGAMQYPDGPAEKFYGMNYEDYGVAGTLECSDDGVTWRKVCDLPTPGGSSGLARRTVAFEPVSASYWRVSTDKDIKSIVLSSRAQTDRWEEKAAYFSEFYEGNATPDYDEGVIRASSIVDLTGKMSSGGKLEWDAPAGDWVIMRFASESTKGAIKHGRNNLMGLECDKMSKAAVRLQWESYAGRIVDTLTRAGSRPLGVTMDSHEAGPQNWTADFRRIFLTVNGYDIIPWLPAMQGCIIRSKEATDQFLLDLRHAIAYGICENYYGELDSICRSEGLEFTAQATGNGLSLVADNVMAKGRPMKPQSEFWARDIHGSYDIVECASAAHLYGRDIASAEAFTDAKYSDSPAKLKQLADFAYASQINEFVVCASAYQPRLDEVPGNVANGRQYCLNRNNSYWPLIRPFWDYQARCAALLRHGEPVVDILVFLGDNPPVKTLAHLLPPVPEGFNFDVTTSDALKGAKVVDNELVLASGMHYKEFVIQRNVTLTDEQRAVVEGWKRSGLPVFEASGIYDEVKAPFAPDLLYSSGRKIDDCVRFSHRRLPEADFYFVYNHSSKAFSQKVAARTPYRLIYKLDPRDGSIHFVSEGSRFNMELEPDEAAFFVFTDKVLAPKEAQNSAETSPQDLGRWKVSFNPQMGGPSRAVVFKDLSDWTLNPDERIKYYSGTAIYSGSFKISPGHNILRLGVLNGMARVYVNGQVAGTIWCSPWTLDISDFLKKGRNQITVEVANSLYNRMIGDASLPESERFTHSNYPLVTTETSLIPSGLVSAMVE